jgi:AraC-like DNA-binding protein/ligand-binding sensor protein
MSFHGETPNLFDPAPAIAAAKTFAGATGVNCLVINSEGALLFEQRASEAGCDFCHRLEDFTGQSPACGKVHLYGCLQACRFGGQYIYYCPNGMAHFASSILLDGQFVGGLVGGPLLITDKEDYIIYDILRKNGLNSSYVAEFRDLLSCFTQTSPENARHLSDLLAITARDVSMKLGGRVLETAEAGERQEDLRYLFELSDIKRGDMIFKAVEYIRNHYTEKLTLEEVAGKIYLSPSYFSRVFKETMGEAFSAYVTHLRINKSKTLLLTEPKTITDICNCLGFDDQSYFTKVFKKHVGVTPAKYRAQRRLRVGSV